MAESTDIVTTLVAAATDAIRSQRRSLNADRGQLRGITLEISLRPNGTHSPVVKTCDCYVMRKVTVADVLGVRG